MLIKAFGVFLLVMASAAAFAEQPQHLSADAARQEFSARMNEGKAGEAEAIARRLIAQETAAHRDESEEMQRGLDLMLESFIHRADRSTPEIDEIGARAMALREKLQGPDSFGAALTLRLWAVAKLGLGDYSGARSMVDRSVKIYEKAERAGTPFSRVDISQYSRAVADMAGILSFMMDWNAAKRAAVKAVALKESISTTSAGLGLAYSNLGRLEHRLGNHADALIHYRRAREILQRAVAADDPLLPELLAQEGQCEFDTGNKDGGRSTMEHALNLREAIHGSEHPVLADTVADLAEIYRSEGRFADARRMLERVVAINRKAYGPLHPDVAESEAHLSQALAETGDAKASLEHALEAERIAREHLSLSVGTLPEREATLFALKRVSALSQAVSVAIDAKGDAIAPVFDALIRSRAIVFDELASRHRLLGAASEDSELIARLSADLRDARERLARLALNWGPDPATRQEQLQHAVEERDAADRKLAGASAQYRHRSSGKSAGLKQVVAALPDDAALVSFIQFAHASRATIKEPDEYAAFVLSKATSSVVWLGSAPEINQAVDDLRAKLAAEAAAPGAAMKRNEVAYRASAEKLRKLVWDPIDRYVASLKRIFIVPDGALHMINFAALPEAGSDGRYLIERGALFHYLSAERDLVTENSVEPSGVGLLAVGNPSFNRPELARGKTQASGAGTMVAAGNGLPVFRGARSSCSAMQTIQFAELPSSAKEVENISRLWKRGVNGEVVELTGELAGPERFKAMAPGRRTIHLAVHGFVAGSDCTDPLRNENPLLLTGLALAGANRRDSVEDGIVTAEEIASLDLRGVEWAVLSACDTGLGKTTQSEGVFGLRRAFQIAGAHTVIMSLWPVEDKVTSDWMQSLYEQRLNKQMDTARSVRAASLETLKRRRAAGQGTHPFYWAPFVAVGDWR